MAKTVAKLFRDPRDAQKALGELKKDGFKEAEIGVLVRPTIVKFPECKTKVSFAGIGEVATNGVLEAPLKEASSAEKPSLTAALVKALGVIPDAADYFEFGVSMGSVLVAVHTEDAKAAKAQDIMRLTGSVPVKVEMPKTSPGFGQAGRMAATDPVDAPMSGDFRKY